MERIAAAACYYRGAVIAVERPKRHRDVLDAAVAMGLAANKVAFHQGFVTSEGRFVLRDEALAIARSAGQLVGERVSQSSDLFSEDVWYPPRKAA